MRTLSERLPILWYLLIILQGIYQADGANGGSSWRSDPFYDLRGRSYCSTIQPTCCTSRRDECSVPILGTLCYCDEFCSSHNNPDCCPDYEQVCLGQSTPETITINRCYINGQYYMPGQALKLNCKDCTCVDMRDRTEIQCETAPCLVENDDIRLVNQEYRARRQTWEASNYTMFWGYKLEEGFRRKLGTLHSRRKVTSMKPLRVVPSRSLPRSFDSNKKWPSYISLPEDQGWCAASWVYSTVGVASDRWAIMSQGKQTEGLSFQHLLGCNNKNQKGCEGGHLTRAWQFIRKFGLVTRSCYRFTGSTTRCNLPKHRNATTARCEARPSRERVPLYRVTPVYRVAGEEAIKHEIYNNGPVQATMKVFKDLFLYRRGVYTCPRYRSERSGFHSVRIVGWGEEVIHDRVLPYWLVANSWGMEWGEQGYFKVRRGTNECGIEDFVLAVWADTSRLPQEFKYDRNELSNSIY